MTAMSPDWQAIETGLRQWVIDMTCTPPHHVAWDWAPVEFRTYNQIDLRLMDHRARNAMGAQITYPEPDDDGTITPIAISERACTWQIVVTTRDQRANHKAYVVLDQLAVMLELPYAQAVFCGLGLSIIGPMQVIVSTNVESEHRDLSQAVLRVELGYVTAVTAPSPAGDVGIIEHAEPSGVAVNIIEPHVVVIPPEMMPPLPPPAPTP